MRLKKKKMVGIILSLVLALGLMPGVGLTAYAADEVKYLEGSWDGTKGKCKFTEQSTNSYIEVTNSSTSWDNGTYVVKSNVTISNRITVNGTVNLILCDEATLTASKGITVTESNTLNIYAQSEGTGTLVVENPGGENAAIGGFYDDDEGEGYNSGPINIHGGNLNVTGGSNAAAIGGGCYATFTSISIYGGTINAISGSSAGAAIGTGDNGSSAGKTITIYGGTINATGVGASAGIGGGGNNGAGTVTIHGGTVTATAGNGLNSYIPAGIGAASYRSKNESVAIYGGTVTAIGGSANAGGIGKNYYRNNTVGSITLGENVKLSHSTDGETYTDYESADYTERYQYMKAETSHAHSFTYSASGATITATCDGMGDCNITDGLTLTISAPTELTYDGNSKAATLSTGYNTTAFPDEYTIKYYQGGNEIDAANVKAAGDYTAKVTVGDATAGVDFTITKATPSIETIPAASAITYGQTLADSTLTDGTAKLGDTTVAGTFTWKSKETKPAVSDSNTTEYDVVFTPTDINNYATVECKVKLTVNKADPTVTAPTAKTLTYNGKVQELLNAGSTGDGKLYYAVTTENTAPTDESLYTTSIPTATDAGTYYVWYKVVGDDNLNNSEAEKVTVTISQLSIKNATVSLDKTDLVYTGSEQSVQVSSVKIGETVLKANSDYEVSGTTGTNKGDYTVTVTGKGNYKDVVTSKWNIAMATPVIDVLPSASAITYGQSLADSTLTEGTAKLGENVVEGTFSWKNDATKPVVSDSEKTEYVVVFTPNDADNLNTVECKVKVTVNKAIAGVAKAPTANTLIYNGKAQVLVKAGEATDGIMNYAIGKDDKTAPAEGWNTSIPIATGAGTYYVWYKVVGDSNHLDSDAGYVTVTIAPADSSDSGSGSTSSGSTDSGSGDSSGDSSDNTNTDTDTSAKVPYEDVAISTGSVKDITGTAAATAEINPFGTKIENNSNLTTLLSLTDAEVAQGVNVWLDVQDMSASVPQTDKTLIQNTSGDYTVGLYLDINLFKKVGSNDATKVTETKGKVKASIVIPESLWKSGRTFEIIRVHDGVATAIAGTYDENTHVFTFETDKFSTYALAYKDPASSSNSGTTSNSSSSNGSNSIQATAPKTGDSNDIRVWYLLLMASLGGLGFIGYSKKKEK